MKRICVPRTKYSLELLRRHPFILFRQWPLVWRKKFLSGRSGTASSYPSENTSSNPPDRYELYCELQPSDPLTGLLSISTMSQLQLRNNKYFPIFSKLPGEHDIDDDFYDLYAHPFLRPIARPSHHRVFLGEIIHDLTFLRPRYIVKDRVGNQIPVHFHHQGIEEFSFKFDPACYIVGHTIAMFYGEDHRFFDMTNGIRVETLRHIKAYSISHTPDGSSHAHLMRYFLQTLLQLMRIQDVRYATSKVRISFFLIFVLTNRHFYTYTCKQKCQMSDWKTHKPKCVALQQVRSWNTRNWDKFTGYWEAF
ncbi:hypothetical protein BDY19DRAFT_908032 [Irpex rosettiformis]|uniref:Uncharacterized protein n=1 Tax=Irpex rosettiformis TaxID=378272 RepID=A0ACB8TXT0_9APHY|nr:hypothetical protein BDY19DRAFT_908032 [Irpex rosettiformis]